MKGKTTKYAIVFSVLLLIAVFTASAAPLKTGSASVNGASVEISLEDATTVSVKYPGAKSSQEILDLASAAAKASPEYFDKAAVVIQKKDAATITLSKSMSTGAFDEFIGNLNKKASGAGSAVLVIDKSSPEIPYYVWVLLAVLLFLLLLLFITTGDKYRYASLPAQKPEDEGEAEAEEAPAEEPAAEEPAAEEVAEEEAPAEEAAEEGAPAEEAAEEEAPAEEAPAEEAAEEEAPAEEPEAEEAADEPAAEEAEEEAPAEDEAPAEEEAAAEEPEAEEAAEEPAAEEAAEEAKPAVVAAPVIVPAAEEAEEEAEEEEAEEEEPEEEDEAEEEAEEEAEAEAEEDEADSDEDAGKYSGIVSSGIDYTADDPDEYETDPKTGKKKRRPPRFYGITSMSALVNMAKNTSQSADDYKNEKAELEAEIENIKADIKAARKEKPVRDEEKIERLKAEKKAKTKRLEYVNTIGPQIESAADTYSCLLRRITGDPSDNRKTERFESRLLDVSSYDVVWTKKRLGLPWKNEE